MKLTKLQEFYTVQAGAPVLFGSFASEVLSAAHFAALIPNIDRIILFNYDVALVKGTPDPTPGTSEYMHFLVMWFIAHTPDFNRMYDVMTADYNPLDNYSMTEATAEAMNRGEVQSETEAEIKPRILSEYSSTNDDHSSGRMTGYSVNGVLGTAPDANPDGKEKTTTKNKYNETKTGTAGNLSATGNEVRTTEHTRAGNIGTVTSQDMAAAELDLRARGFINEFLKMFAADCLTGLYDLSEGGYY